MIEMQEVKILSTPGWDDYELIDSGNGYRLERFGKYILSRPDPQIIWKKKLSQDVWDKADAYFKRIEQDRGQWIKKNPALPDKWLMTYKQLSFWVKLSPFKHTGVFPEQCVQWDFINNIIINYKQESTPLSPPAEGMKGEGFPNILNLFAYTGIASLAAASAGAKVTHVDASKPAIGWAKENQEASQLGDKPIRWILDDCMKFVQREIKRGVKYDGIILDPPAFGHGPDGKIWKFNDHFPKLLELCKQILSDKPLFILVNAYAISSSALMLQNVLKDYLGDLQGTIEVGELALQEKNSERVLSTGIFAKWYRK